MSVTPWDTSSPLSWLRAFYGMARESWRQYRESRRQERDALRAAKWAVDRWSEAMDNGDYPMATMWRERFNHHFKEWFRIRGLQ